MMVHVGQHQNWPMKDTDRYAVLLLLALWLWRSACLAPPSIALHLSCTADDCRWYLYGLRIFSPDWWYLYACGGLVYLSIFESNLEIFSQHMCVRRDRDRDRVTR